MITYFQSRLVSRLADISAGYYRVDYRCNGVPHTHRLLLSDVLMQEPAATVLPLVSRMLERAARKPVQDGGLTP